ncbi:Farnesyl pyrophosphate synthetase [Hordeum vulgare]|nr:Farnesyl pyrophosphate synthetase [Hordeum vulgare]
MNFPEVATPERAQELAPPPWLVTDEDRRENRRQERRLAIAEMDEETMAVWCQHFSEDVVNERESYTKGGRSEPPIVRTGVRGRRSRSSTSSSKKRRPGTTTINDGMTPSLRRRSRRTPLSRGGRRGVV